MSDKQRAAMTAAQNKILDRRFCTNCQRQQAVEGGTKKGHRWMCGACVSRRIAGTQIGMYGPTPLLRR